VKAAKNLGKISAEVEAYGVSWRLAAALSECALASSDIENHAKYRRGVRRCSGGATSARRRRHHPLRGIKWLALKGLAALKSAQSLK